MKFLLLSQLENQGGRIIGLVNRAVQIMVKFKEKLSQSQHGSSVP